MIANLPSLIESLLVLSLCQIIKSWLLTNWRQLDRACVSNGALVKVVCVEILTLISHAVSARVEFVGQLVVVAACADGAGGNCGFEETIATALWINLNSLAVLGTAVVSASGHGHAATSGSLRCVHEVC